MTKLLFTLVLFISCNSIAKPYSALQRESRLQGTTPCTTCTRPAEQSLEQIRDIQNILTVDANAENIFDINEIMNFADRCEPFAGEQDLGKWGFIIVNQMHRERYEELYKGSPDLVRVCPNYHGLNDDGKELVWVMILNAMAHLESSCDKTSKAKGPNGSLVGLLQLHRGRENAYAEGCRVGDGNTPAGTFRCALSMINGQLERDDALFSRKSYWDVLRPQARSQKYLKVQAAIKKLSICK